MAEAKQKAEWAQVSSLMALIANCHRDPKRSRAFRPMDFNPMVEAKKVKISAKEAFPILEMKGRAAQKKPKKGQK